MIRPTSMGPAQLNARVRRHVPPDKTACDDPAQSLLTLRRLGYLTVFLLPFVSVALAIIVLWNQYVGPRDVVLLIALYSATGLGVSVGYHRMLTHGSFHTYPAIRYTFALLGSMAAEGPPSEWVATHRKHHAFSDRPGDPHSPHEGGAGLRGAIVGLFHAHAGWYFCQCRQKTGSVCTRSAYRSRHSVDRPLSTHHYLCGISPPVAIGYAIHGYWQDALSALVWGGFVRIFLVHHMVRSIDSICHFFGRQDFATHDESRNVGWLAVLSLGESWHNDHHAFPASAHIGLRPRNFDIAGMCITALERVGLAWHVGRVSQRQMRRKHLLGVQPVTKTK